MFKFNVEFSDDGLILTNENETISITVNDFYTRVALVDRKTNQVISNNLTNGIGELMIKRNI